MASDTIRLVGLRVIALCGALPEERVRRQPFRLDIEVEVDLSTAGRSDDLNDTIDYGALCDLVAETVTTEQYTLIEAMAERVAGLVLADERATGVTVTVSKLRPPVAHDLAASGVTITR